MYILTTTATYRGVFGVPWDQTDINCHFQFDRHQRRDRVLADSGELRILPTNSSVTCAVVLSLKQHHFLAGSG